MSDALMREFWDDRAAENALFFVDNRIRYDDPDLDEFWRSGREQLERMHEHLGVAVRADDDVVEIGCGVGRMTRELAARARSVVAIDVSEEMLTRARELNPDLANVRWALGDGRSLQGIDSASADVVHSYVVFHHIPDPEITMGYVTEIGRVLRGGGWAGLQVSNDPAKHGRLPLAARLRSWWRAVRGRGPRGQSHPAWRGSAVDLDRLRLRAKEAGLVVDRVVGEGAIYCLVLLRKPLAGRAAADPE